MKRFPGISDLVIIFESGGLGCYLHFRHCLNLFHQ